MSASASSGIEGKVAIVTGGSAGIGEATVRRLCGFDLRFALPSESTFSRAFDEFAASELIQRVHARMIKDTLGEQLIGLGKESAAVEAAGHRIALGQPAQLAVLYLDALPGFLQLAHGGTKLFVGAVHRGDVVKGDHAAPHTAFGVGTG